MNITKVVKELHKYKDSLNKVYDNLSDFEITLITNAFINGYRTGYNKGILDHQKEIDSQENIYAYESKK